MNSRICRLRRGAVSSTVHNDLYICTRNVVFVTMMLRECGSTSTVNEGGSLLYHLWADAVVCVVVISQFINFDNVLTPLHKIRFSDFDFALFEGVS